MMIMFYPEEISFELSQACVGCEIFFLQLCLFEWINLEGASWFFFLLKGVEDLKS